MKNFTVNSHLSVSSFSLWGEGSYQNASIVNVKQTSLLKQNYCRFASNFREKVPVSSDVSAIYAHARCHSGPEFKWRTKHYGENNDRCRSNRVAR